MQPVKRNQSFNRLFMPGRNRWPWDLAGSSWLTIRHVTLAEATISSPDPKQEARCELLPPPTLLLYSQYTRLQAVLGTLHYNCIVFSWWPRHISIYRLAHRELWVAHQPLCNLIIITISTGSALCTIYWDSQTSVSECEASASTALVPLIKLMMCVRQISFYFAHKIPKAEQQLETTPYLSDSSNRRSLHNIFTTPRFVLCCIWKNTFWKKYVFLLWILSHLKGLQVLYGLLNNGFKVWLYYHNLWHPNYVLIIILEGMWCL